MLIDNAKAVATRAYSVGFMALAGLGALADYLPFLPEDMIPRWALGLCVVAALISRFIKQPSVSGQGASDAA